MNLNPEEKTVGKENYLSAVEALDKKNQGDFAKSAAANAAAANEPNDANRRKFLKDIVGLGIVSGAGLVRPTLATATAAADSPSRFA